MNDLRWVTVELPWTISLDAPEYLEVWRISEEYRMWFDAEVVRKFGSRPELSNGDDYMYEFLELNPGLEESDWLRISERPDTDPDVKEIAVRNLWTIRTRQWEETDPEATSWQEKIEAAVKVSKTTQFRSHPMRVPGIALEIRNPAGELRRVMLGDCDGSGSDLAQPVITEGDVVVRYMDVRPVYLEWQTL